MAREFIKEAIKKPGALRKALGIKEGETIPHATLVAASKKPGKLGRRARLALTLKKLRRRKGSSSHNPAHGRSLTAEAAMKRR